MKFYVPQRKIDNLLNFLKHASRRTFASARQISKIAGRIISMQIAIGPLTRLFTRQMYLFIENRMSWDSYSLITNNLKTEIEFWLRNLEKHNGSNVAFHLFLAIVNN